MLPELCNLATAAPPPVEAPRSASNCLANGVNVCNKHHCLPPTTTPSPTGMWMILDITAAWQWRGWWIFPLFRSAGECHVWYHKNTAIWGEVGKETHKKEMDNRLYLDVFLWRDAWHFQVLPLLNSFLLNKRCGALFNKTL